MVWRVSSSYEYTPEVARAPKKSKDYIFIHYSNFLQTQKRGYGLAMVRTLIAVQKVCGRNLAGDSDIF